MHSCASQHVMGISQIPAVAIDGDTAGALDIVAHRPFPIPDRPWTMTQRWNDLLFAHWPVAADEIRALVPLALELDTFDGSAWVGVVPFWMDRIRARIPGTNRFSVPIADSFPELNLRTYVRSKSTGRAGVYFFALEAANPFAVAGARTLFHLPYFLASMLRRTAGDGTVRYSSRRLLTSALVGFQAAYRGLERSLGALPSEPGSLEHFLTERYCLFTTFRGQVLVGDIHHRPWPLEAAEAEIRANTLPRAHRVTLPDHLPILHFSRSLEVYIWSLRPDGSV